MNCLKTFKQKKLAGALKMALVGIVVIITACSNNQQGESETEINEAVYQVADETEVEPGDNLFLASVGEYEDFDSTESEGIFPTISIENRLYVKPSRETLSDEIASVIYDNQKFKDAWSGKYYSFKDYSIAHELGGYPEEENYPLEYANVYWHEYLIMDFDRDGYSELVYEVNCNVTHDYMILFHWNHEEVLAYRLYSKDFEQVRIDGTIKEENGWADYCYYTIEAFEEKSIVKNVLASVERTNSTPESDIYTPTYRVGNDIVTEDFFYESYLSSLDSVELAEWVIRQE